MTAPKIPPVPWHQVDSQVRAVDSTLADLLEELDEVNRCPPLYVVTPPYGSRIFEDGHLSGSAENIPAVALGLVLDGCCERSQQRRFTQKKRQEGDASELKVLDPHRLYYPGELVGLEAAASALTSCTPFAHSFEVITAGSTSAKLLWNWDWHSTAESNQKKLQRYFWETNTGLKKNVFDDDSWENFTSYRIDELCSFLGVGSSWQTRLLLMDISALATPAHLADYKLRDHLLGTALQATEGYQLLATDIYPQIDPTNRDAKLAYGIWQTALRLQLIRSGAMPVYAAVGDNRPASCGPFTELKEILESNVLKDDAKSIVILEPSNETENGLLPFFDFSTLRTEADPGQFSRKIPEFLERQHEASIFRNLSFVRRPQLEEDPELREALFHTRHELADRHEFFGGFLRIGK